MADAIGSEVVIGSHENHAVCKDDGNENGHASSDGGRDDICRDFLKNICNRGSRCKFYHPPDAKPLTDDQINFCIDYQNRGCMRENCRFVHAPRDEVERYKHTREVTLPLARAIAAVSQGDTIAGIPVCKEFQTGKCARGVSRCRYWHVNVDQERERRLRGLPPSGEPTSRLNPTANARFGATTSAPSAAPENMYGMRRSGPPMEMYEVKRPRMDDQRILELERKNAELMKEVETLKREVQREHERYEDLYALFRQQSANGNLGPSSGSKPGHLPNAPYAAYGGWNTGSWN